MNTTNVNPVTDMDIQLQQKITEYTLAEKQGKPKETLLTIYKEIKNIKYQLIQKQINKK